MTAYTYDAAARTLTVTYPRGVEVGKTYVYSNVPSHTVAALDRAESKRSFLAKYIKGKFTHREIKP